MTEIAYYLYCLTSTEYRLRLNESGVFVRPVRGVSAVLSETPREEFCGEGAEARMQDLAWLAPRACRHESVVERVMQQAPVLPARFATLFSSFDTLRSFVLEHHDTIAMFLAGLAGRREWAVKGMLDRSATGAARAAAGGGSPGRDYLQRRRAQADRKGEVTARLRTTCEEIAGVLRRKAPDFRERGVWNAGPSADGTTLLLNWAFLVPPEAEPEFDQLVGRLGDEHAASGLRLTLSGPWPPYSFVPALSWQ